MPKLKTIKPLISTMKPMVATSRGEGKDRRSFEAEEWRAWYKTYRWQQLRLRVFARDNYTCQRTGIVLSGKHPAPNSPVANHRIPHKGNPALFWDIDNLETVAKSVHDSQVQKEERAMARNP